MTSIAAKQFVGPLSDKSYFDVLAGSFTDEVHRDNRGSRDRFFQRFDNPRQRLLEDGSGNRDGGVLRSQNASRFCSICQFIVSEGGAVAYGVGRPTSAVEIH